MNKTFKKLEVTFFGPRCVCAVLAPRVQFNVSKHVSARCYYDDDFTRNGVLGWPLPGLSPLSQNFALPIKKRLAGKETRIHYCYGHAMLKRGVKKLLPMGLKRPNFS